MIKTKLKIRTFGDPCLRKKSTPVKEVGAPERMLIDAMLFTISEKETDIGLAASQVGINKQIFVVDLPDFPHVFINLKIIKIQGKEAVEEGCLSFPGIAFKVTRPKKIWVEYLDQDNKKCHLTCEGLYARVILHENDHVHGKLIVDYAQKADLLKQKEALASLEEETKKALKMNS